MKKVIAILLAVVLVAGGLGGFAYAQDTPEVSAAFVNNWTYSVPGDNFTNHQVTGNKGWSSRLSSIPWYGASGPVINATLSLDSKLTFDQIKLEPNVMGPPIYEWSFSNPEEGPFFWIAMLDLNEATVVFIPGVDCSRSVDQTVFSEEADQTLTIKVTPQGEEFESFGVIVPVQDDDKVKAVPDKDSVIGPGEALWVETFPGEPALMIVNNEAEIGTEYTYTVTIEVTLKEGISEVEFMPEVNVSDTGFTVLASGNVEGSAVSYTMSEVGTWTWSAAEGTYNWHWKECIAKGITLLGRSRGIVEPILHEPMTGQKLVGCGAYGVFPPEEDGTFFEVAGSFTLTNPDCVSEITIDRISIFDFDGTVIYEGDLFSVDWEGGEPVVTPWTESLKPHEQRWIEVDSTMVYLRDQGYWEGDMIFFTVEIFWTKSDKEGLPLTGWFGGRVAKRDADWNIIEFQSGSGTQMVNMEQVLEPEKPK